MQEIILYTSNCPKCKMLKEKLNVSNISYEEFTDVEEMLKMGLESVPMLKANEQMLSFSEAIRWIEHTRRDAND